VAEIQEKIRLMQQDMASGLMRAIDIGDDLRQWRLRMDRESFIKWTLQNFSMSYAWASNLIVLSFRREAVLKALAEGTAESTTAMYQRVKSLPQTNVEAEERKQWPRAQRGPAKGSGGRPKDSEQVNSRPVGGRPIPDDLRNPNTAGFQTSSDPELEKRLETKITARLQKEAEEEVRKAIQEIKEGFKKEWQELYAKEEELNRAIRRHNERDDLNKHRGASVVMTYKQWRSFVGLCHSDKWPEIDSSDKRIQGLQDLFNCLQKMKKLVNPMLPISELRRKGWEDIAPPYKRRKSTKKAPARPEASQKNKE
jgi:hypothetical protein